MEVMSGLQHGWQEDIKPRLNLVSVTPVAKWLIITLHCPSTASEMAKSPLVLLLSYWQDPFLGFKGLFSEKKNPKQVLLCVPWLLQSLYRNHEELYLTLWFMTMELMLEMVEF